MATCWWSSGAPFAWRGRREGLTMLTPLVCSLSLTPAMCSRLAPFHSSTALVIGGLLCVGSVTGKGVLRVGDTAVINCHAYRFRSTWICQSFKAFAVQIQLLPIFEDGLNRDSFSVLYFLPSTLSYGASHRNVPRNF